MALTASGLAAAITTAQGPAEDTSVQNDANMKLATGIIGYLIANAVVEPGIPVATAGSPSAQTGATTGPGTID